MPSQSSALSISDLHVATFVVNTDAAAEVSIAACCSFWDEEHSRHQLTADCEAVL
jgi:hypothetical protein